MATSSKLLQGTLDVLVLKTLAWGPAHGYAVARWIARQTDDALEIEDGSLYPALHRLERQGLVEARWGASENNRRAKFYQLTDDGRSRLGDEVASWERIARAVASVLESTERPSWAEEAS